MEALRQRETESQIERQTRTLALTIEGKRKERDLNMRDREREGREVRTVFCFWGGDRYGEETINNAAAVVFFYVDTAIKPILVVEPSPFGRGL